MSRFAIVCALFLAASPVMAEQNELSWGVMLGSSNYSDASNYSADMTTITGRGMYDINSWLGAEGRLAYGNSGSSNGVSIGINWLTGAYLKVSWEVIERLKITAYGGYTVADTTAKGSGGQSTVTDDSPSAGLSLDFYANASSGLNIEWMRYLDSTARGADYTIDHIGIGYFQRY